VYVGLMKSRVAVAVGVGPVPALTAVAVAQESWQVRQMCPKVVVAACARVQSTGLVAPPLRSLCTRSCSSHGEHDRRRRVDVAFGTRHARSMNLTSGCSPRHVTVPLLPQSSARATTGLAARTGPGPCANYGGGCMRGMLGWGPGFAARSSLPDPLTDPFAAHCSLPHCPCTP
jgi:hypothetical protein